MQKIALIVLCVGSLGKDLQFSGQVHTVSLHLHSCARSITAHATVHLGIINVYNITIYTVW